MIITFDLETTGVGPDARIVEIALKKETGETYSVRVNPEIPIEPGATNVHGITNEDAAKEKPFSDLADEVLEFINVEEAILGGFNIRHFDIPVLRRELTRIGKALPNLPLIDSFEINKKLNPRSLERCYRLYTGKDMDPERAHNAMYDVECTIKALAGMVKKHKLEDEDLTKFAEPEFLPVCGSPWFAFKDMDVVAVRGKHADENLTLLTVASKYPGYIQWMLKLKDLDNETRLMISLAKEDKISELFAMIKEYHPDRPEITYITAKYYLQYKYSDKVLERAIAISKMSVSHAFLAFFWAHKNNHPDTQKMLELYQCEEDMTTQAKKRQDFIGGLKNE